MTQSITPTADLSRVPTGTLILQLSGLDRALMDSIASVGQSLDSVYDARRLQELAEQGGWSDRWQRIASGRVRTAETLAADTLDDVLSDEPDPAMARRRSLHAELTTRGVACPCGEDGATVLMAWRSLASTVRMAREVNRVMCRSDADRQRLAGDWARLTATCAEHGITDMQAVIRRKPLPA